MRFLFDAQLPPALARLLADRGHVAEHVGDVGLPSSSLVDPTIAMIDSGDRLIELR